VQLESLRSQIGMVMQETFLFNMTIRENISYGRSDATQEEIEAAARAANAHDFIMDLEEGYDTLTGERGVRLSGGQRQRIAIARAILVDPRILILDEATSSVDNRTDFMIRQALDKLMQGRTTIVIAHRLSTVQRAHQIAVMEKGTITAIGTHEELLHSSPLYQHLNEIQFQLQNDGGEGLGVRDQGSGARGQGPGTKGAGNGALTPDSRPLTPAGEVRR
jgi:subfamily B ATP-binding cassette protein MsbA